MAEITAKEAIFSQGAFVEEGVALADFLLPSTGEKAHKLAEEIALGQSLGAWSTQFASAQEMAARVARIAGMEELGSEELTRVTVEFPISLWSGRLDWLLKSLFGKMSFVPGVSLERLRLRNCPQQYFPEPVFDLQNFRKEWGLPGHAPLLMGILKPAVALADDQVAQLICAAGDAGIHLVKDDEIRHDASRDQVLGRIERVAEQLERHELGTLYAAHFQFFSGDIESDARAYESAGARALLVSPWIDGLAQVQRLRKATSLPLLMHPSLAGAFGLDRRARVHPQVTLGAIPRLVGADLSLFPSPFGSLGLGMEICRGLHGELQHQDEGFPKRRCPLAVPSAGIRPEHAGPAFDLFGPNHVLNAGTALFADAKGVKDAVRRFLCAQKAAWETDLEGG